MTRTWHQESQITHICTHTQWDREINTLVLSSHTLGHCRTLLRDSLPDQWQPHTHPHKHIHTSFSQDPKSPNPLVPCRRCETSTMALWVFEFFFSFLVLPFIGYLYNYKKQLPAFDEWCFFISVWDARAVLFNHWFISILLNVRFRRDVTACCKPRTKIFCLHEVVFSGRETVREAARVRQVEESQKQGGGEGKRERWTQKK